MEEEEAELQLHLLVPSTGLQKLSLSTVEQVVGLGLHRPIVDQVEEAVYKQRFPQAWRLRSVEDSRSAPGWEAKVLVQPSSSPLYLE